MVVLLKRPFTFILSEMTLDGKLTSKKGESSKLIMEYMDEASKKFLHEQRASSDAIMVGCNTIKIDDSSLTVRYAEGKNPLRVIPCSLADIPLDSNVLEGDAPTIIATSERAPKENIDAIKERNAEVIVCGRDKVDLKLLMDKLFKRGIERLMVEGGPTLLWNLLKNRLVDEIKIIHIPFIVGGRDAPSLVGGEGIKSLNESIWVELKDTKMVGRDLVTEYDVVYEKR
jgi:2,5-diamino-6-hydroxy-4-(5-phosphoribosylamino)pyrimidine 1''-reductase, archaeal